ncbi:MAG: hypothetical protein LBG45_06040 [Dysgonamonadaceae bacterium]|nr:hypothetical protein [Dysgonamonadaceae bacterium]
MIEYICTRYSFLSYTEKTVLIHAPAMLSDYRAKLTREMTFYKWSRSGGFTAKKAKTDRERDRILSRISAGFRFTVHRSPFTTTH